MEAMFRTVISLKVAAIPHRHLYKTDPDNGEDGSGEDRDDGDDDSQLGFLTIVSHDVLYIHDLPSLP